MLNFCVGLFQPMKESCLPEKEELAANIKENWAKPQKEPELCLYCLL